MDSGIIKTFFHEWCDKNRLRPNFLVLQQNQTGPKAGQRFLCELRVDGYSFVGAGYSVFKKKYAEIDAARRFVEYLVQSGEIQSSDVPVDISNSDVPIARDAIPPKEIQEATRANTDAEIYGNWTFENAKIYLHNFMNRNKIKANYKYTILGTDYSRNFKAEMSIFVHHLDLTVNGQGTSTSKNLASKLCALSIMRQLFVLGAVEAFSENGNMKCIEEKIISYPVNISPDLVDQLDKCIEDLNLNVISSSSFKPLAEKEEPIWRNSDPLYSILDYVLELAFAFRFFDSDTIDCFTITRIVGSNSFVEKGQLLDFWPMKYEKPEARRNSQSKELTESVIPWAPPQPYWHTWNACSMDVGNLANLDKLSEELYKQEIKKKMNNVDLENVNKIRSSLPIAAMRNEIMTSISDYPVVIIRGDPGCGKSTQIAQYILEDYIASEQGAYCNIYITQPHKLSVILAAERVATERNENLGESVGYNVHVDTICPRPYGALMFCTADVLLRKLVSGLRGVSHIIVDEIHERDIKSDFLLTVLRDMVHTYPDLRVILMSATNDTALFSDYFDKAPVFQVPRRAFPVQQMFLEDITKLNVNTYSEYKQSKRDFELIASVMRITREKNIPGAILVFVPNRFDIRNLMKYLQANLVFGSSEYRILPCHSQISIEDARKLFGPVPKGVTKIILSTDIGETSITFDDIVYVIDTCKNSKKALTPQENSNHETSWVSKTNLEQRKGHAGRVCPGYCFTLCSKEQLANMQVKNTPEMLRTPLHQLALSVKLLRLGSIQQFFAKAIEPPPMDAVISAEVLLRDMNCLDDKDDLTPLGTILARLHIQPCFGKMIILGCVFGVADPIAVMSIYSNSFMQLGNGKVEYQNEQKLLAGKKYSDHIAMLVAYDMWEHARSNGDGDGKHFCESKGLEPLTLRMIAKEKAELLEQLKQAGFSEKLMRKCDNNADSDDTPEMDTSIALLCSGLYPKFCVQAKGKRRLLTNDRKIALLDKHSVNHSHTHTAFPHPFFVFGGKTIGNVMICSQVTMIPPIPLLLFGCRKIDLVEKKGVEMIQLDDWCNFKMDVNVGAKLAALRPAIEDLITLASATPDKILNMTSPQRNLINLIKKLCRTKAGDDNIKRENTEFSTKLIREDVKSDGPSGKGGGKFSRTDK